MALAKCIFVGKGLITTNPCEGLPIKAHVDQFVSFDAISKTIFV